MASNTINVGIDLGTVNTSIAVWHGGDAKVIQNKAGAMITPSAVWADRRCNIRVGEEAKKRALGNDPENAWVEFKLLMGLGDSARKPFSRCETSMLPEEASAEILKSVKTDYQTSSGNELRSAVITVPAAFENAATAATRRAAQLAGLDHSPLLLEPVAASLAYGLQSQAENVYWLVYDFGGGTFDAAVMRVRDGFIDVVSHEGNNHLGGKLIDWDIVSDRLIPSLTNRFNLPDFRRGSERWSHAIGRLKYEAERAKIEVSRTRQDHEVWIEGLCEDADGKEVDVEFVLTPSDVEALSRPHIERSLHLCRKALSEKGLAGSDLERVLMVGGSTLSPWVREAVGAEISANVECELDPVTIVARGAAIFASAQPLPTSAAPPVPVGVWSIEIEHEPVGNVPDPDIGGRVVPPEGQEVVGCTVEFVDEQTRWRSGRVVLGTNGVFMTQLYAEKERVHRYAVELCDKTGTRLPVSPDSIEYRIGPVFKSPPAAMTLGVGLANDTVAVYIAKGTKLPARKSLDHYTTVPLRADVAEDELQIPLLEGEHSRAVRNHLVGRLTIRGSDIKRDLPTGSMVEITLIMDESQQVRAQAFIGTLDQDFEISFDPQTGYDSLESLSKTASDQKKRLGEMREQAGHTGAAGAQEAMRRIDGEALVEGVDKLLDSAHDDPEILLELDRRLRELASVVDQAEDAIEFPRLAAEAREGLDRTRELVDQVGEPDDLSRFVVLDAEFEGIIATGDVDVLRRHTSNVDTLRFAILERMDVFHLKRFEWLVEQKHVMRDADQAGVIINQGRRALDAGDLEGLKAANRQLIMMLPPEMRNDPALPEDEETGDTLTF